MSDEPKDLLPLPTAPWDERPVEVPLTVEECRTALWRATGNISVAASILKVSSQRLRAFVKSSPRLQREMEEAKEVINDKAERIVVEALEATSDPSRQDQMARFVLGTIGRARGWSKDKGGGVTINANNGRFTIAWDDGTIVAGEGSPVIEGEVVEAAE